MEPLYPRLPDETYTLEYAGVRQKAPNASGVYTISSPSHWVYVGESSDIQQSLFQHLNTGAPCMNQFGPLSFSFELQSEVARLDRYRALVEGLKPVCNVNGVPKGSTASSSD